MPVISGLLVPHPPLIFPEVGQGRENDIADTVEAYKTVAKEIAAVSPDVIVVVSPHSNMFSDYIHISPGPGAEGDMRSFGVSGVKIKAEYDSEFVEALSLGCAAEDLRAGTTGERNRALDHATSIPVRFINDAYGDFTYPKYVRVGISEMPLEEHYRLGQLIAEVSEQLGRKAVVIASGDLSHKLSDDGPYGFSEYGVEFDRIICDVCYDAEFSKLLEMDSALCIGAGECGHRPFVVMAGALDRKAVDSKLYSYECPFGVGYAVASFVVKGPDDSRDFLDRYLDGAMGNAAERKSKESPYVTLARETVENYVKTGRVCKTPEPLAEEFTKERAGVFVSIKKHGELRGCIGTIAPVTGCVGEEIRSNAVSASTRDPRFAAVSEDELPFLEYSVDVLAPAEQVDNADALDPAKYGVIVSLGGKRGLLLPDLEGIDDAESQISIAMRKAGIAERDRNRVNLERFEVIRYR